MENENELRSCCNQSAKMELIVVDTFRRHHDRDHGGDVTGTRGGSTFVVYQVGSTGTNQGLFRLLDSSTFESH